MDFRLCAVSQTSFLFLVFTQHASHGIALEAAHVGSYAGPTHGNSKGIFHARFAYQAALPSKRAVGMQYAVQQQPAKLQRCVSSDICQHRQYVALCASLLCYSRCRCRQHTLLVLLCRHVTYAVQPAVSACLLSPTTAVARCGVGCLPRSIGNACCNAVIWHVIVQV